MADPLQLPQLQQTSPSPAPLSIDVGKVPDPITEPVADSRATKAYWGVGHLLNKDKDGIKAALQQGQEKNMRQEAATKADSLSYDEQRMNFFKKLTNNEASVDDLNSLQQAQGAPVHNPDTIFEQGYAQNYINAIDKLNLSSPDTPEPQDLDKLTASNMLRSTGESIIAQREWIQTKLEDVESEVSKEGTGQKVVDFFKGFIPGINEYQQRGLTSEEGWTANFIGTALKAQADEILALPLPEAKEKLDGIIKYLLSADPPKALTFMHYLAGQSLADERLDNVFGAVDDILSASVIGDVAKIGLQGLKALTKSAVKAVDLVPEVSPHVAVAVGEGNLKEAAVQQAAETFVADTKGTIDPLKRAMEAIPTYIRRDAKARKADPGNYGTDLENRMEEADAEAIAGLREQVLGTARTNRITEVTVAKAHWDTVAKEVIASDPGTSGHIMNIKGPIWDPLGASWFLGRIIGRSSGEYFASMGEARALALSKDIPLTNVSQNIVKKTIPGTKTEVSSLSSVINYGAEIRHIKELGLQGDGWYITDLLPVSETTPTIRDLLGTTPRATAPIDWTGGFIDASVGWLLRSPDSTQSLDQQIARKQATYGPANYIDFVRKVGKDIRRLSPASSLYGVFHKQEWKDFEQTLRYAQSAVDPSNPKQKGWFFETPGQLASHYFATYNKVPSERTVAAYFTFKRMVEIDRWFRTMAVMRNKQRIGVMAHTAILETPEGLMKIPFEGVRLPVQEIPQGDDTILFLKRDPNHTRLYGGNKMPQYFRDEANKDLKEGRGHIFEVFNTEERPFRAFTGRVRGALRKDVDISNAKVRYVFARRAETRPLDVVGQIPRRFGGHLVPDYEYQIAQPNMQFDPITNTWHYEGDNHAYFVGNHKLGQEFAKRMNEHQDLLRSGREAEALEYARDNLHVPAEEHHANYKSSVGPGGEKFPARWSLNEPFQVKRTGTNIIDTGKSALEDRYSKIVNGKLVSKFRDGTRSGNLARTSLVEFTQQRDAYEYMQVANKGTSSNPVYHVDPANLIDPLPMLMRGLKRIVHSLQMDDYKLQAMEHWLFGKWILNPETGKMVGAADLMHATRSEIEHSPFHYFNLAHPYSRGIWKTGIDPKVLALVLGDKMKIDMFIGTPNAIDGVLHSVEQAAADKVYGSDTLKKLHDGKLGDYIVPTWAISKLSNGPRFVRNMLYGVKIGFFAPRQFFLHFVTTANAVLIDPVHAFHGVLGGMLHGFTAYNAKPEIIAYLDKLAVKSGMFKPGDFTTFRKALIDSGFIKLESGQLSMRDSPMSAEILRNRWQTLLHAGTSPFRAGVTGVRAIAWYMAAAAWRAGKLGRSHSLSRFSTKTPGGPPVGALTAKDAADIFNRADDLAHNMSRASSSAIQKGMTSFSTQFTGFNLRVLDLLADKRLTVPEKVRFLFGYSALYGVPAAGGIFGLSTYIRKLAQGRSPTTNKPYVPGENMLDTVIMEGLIATAIYKGTGHLPNVGEAFGAKDLDFVDETFNSDPTWYDLWGGAALHGIINTGESITPFITWADTILNDNNERFRITPQHWVGLLKEISVVNYAWRAYMGATAHIWLSRNWSYMGDTSATNAIIQNFFGTQDQDLADIYNKSRQIHDWRGMESNAIKWVARETQMEFEALSAKNYSEAELHHMNAKLYSKGIPEQERAKVMTRIYHDVYTPLKDKVDLEFYLGRDRPDSIKKSGRDAWSDILRMRQEQGK